MVGAKVVLVVVATVVVVGTNVVQLLFSDELNADTPVTRCKLNFLFSRKSELQLRWIIAKLFFPNSNSIVTYHKHN